MGFDHGGALPKVAHTVNGKSGKRGICSQVSEVDPAARPRIRKDPFRSEPRQIGYIRISTPAQLTDRQTLQLEAACDEMRSEQVSAVAAQRPIFEALMKELSEGDTLVVVDLDRAFRSSIDAILTAEELRRRGVYFRLLSFPIDTASEEGELFYTILAAFAQFERRMISRRTREGMAAARRRGARLGRPALLSPETIRSAHDWIADTGLPCAYVSALLGVSRLTLQRGFHRLGLTYPL